MILKKLKKSSKSKGKVLVAMSGGVDSSVAACLLKKAGYEVAGATIKTWVSGSCPDKNTRACCNMKGIEDARSVCEQLEAPYYVLDFEEDFKRDVVDYFTSEYKKGRTPNPCVICNRIVKFGKFIERAGSLGYDFMATGHYAKRIKKGGRFYIQEGVDKTKDQAYVLALLTQDILSKTLLPNGKQTKKKIRKIAHELNLEIADKEDSMEICFIPSNNYAMFLEREGIVKSKKGDIRFKDGKKLGEHDGYFHYTIGQRRGLGVGHKEPLYVIELRPDQNQVIVGTKQDVLAKDFTVTNINWVKPLRGGEELKVEVKIRANSPKAKAVIKISEDKDSARVSFKNPQEAITPGQAGVFYEKDVVIGGGWIEEVVSS